MQHALKSQDIHSMICLFLIRVNIDSKPDFHLSNSLPGEDQGCIICSFLPSGMGAREVSSEHVENMEMFSCSPTEVRSDSQRT